MREKTKANIRTKKQNGGGRRGMRYLNNSWKAMEESLLMLVGANIYLLLYFSGTCVLVGG